MVQCVVNVVAFRVYRRMSCVYVCVFALDWYLPRRFSGPVYREGCFDVCVVSVLWEGCVVQVLLGGTGGCVPVMVRLL